MGLFVIAMGKACFCSLRTTAAPLPPSSEERRLHRWSVSVSVFSGTGWDVWDCPYFYFYIYLNTCPPGRTQRGMKVKLMIHCFLKIPLIFKPWVGFFFFFFSKKCISENNKCRGVDKFVYIATQHKSATVSGSCWSSPQKNTPHSVIMDLQGSLTPLLLFEENTSHLISVSTRDNSVSVTLTMHISSLALHESFCLASCMRPSGPLKKVLSPDKKGTLSLDIKHG